MPQVNAKVSEETHKRLLAEAARREWTPSQWARKAIEEKLARDQAKAKGGAR